MSEYVRITDRKIELTDEGVEALMSDYIPDTGKVRTAYIHGVGGTTWYEGKADALLKQFDRWLFEVTEDAFDAGYKAGLSDGKDSD